MTDKSNASDALSGGGKRFFEGDVAFDALFEANENLDDFGSTTFLHFFDDSSGGLLQTVEYHTSCSQPIQLGDVIGNATLVAYQGEAGSAVLPPDPLLGPDPVILTSDDPIFQFDVPFDSSNVGVDADEPAGPIAQIGDKITHTYVVTNPGSVPLTITSLFDDNETPELSGIPGDGSDDFEPLAVLKPNGFNFGDDNDDGLLDPGETWYFQIMRMAVEPGQHTNVAKVIGVDAGGTIVMDDDPSNYIVNPLEFEKLVFVPPAPSSEDQCEVHGKVVGLIFQYLTGTNVNTAQDSGKAEILFDSGAVDDDGVSFVIVTDESNASDALSGGGKRFFEGDVAFDALFEANENLDDFGSTTFLHFFDDSSGGLLQTVEYHTSCSQPIQLGDVIGNATLVGYAGESGSATVDPGGALGDPADTATGPTVLVGDEVRFNFVVTNAGNVDLTNVEVTDSVLGAITEFVDMGDGDNLLSPGETWILTATTLAGEVGQQMNLGTVMANTVDDLTGEKLTASDPAHHLVESLKFFVVDKDADAMFTYSTTGNPVGSTALDGGNHDARGAASNPAGDTLWVIDKDKNVYVYDAGGNSLGDWEADKVSDKNQGIATDGEDIWIVDDDKDRVYFFDGGASLLSGKHDPTSQFDLVNGNDHPKGITADGNFLWVVDDGNDSVYKYTSDGVLVSSWPLDGSNAKPRGITINPFDAADDTIWVVDQDADKVFEYAGGKTDAGGSLSSMFNLAAGNGKPEGIADPHFAPRPSFIQIAPATAVPAESGSPDFAAGVNSYLATGVTIAASVQSDQQRIPGTVNNSPPADIAMSDAGSVPDDESNVGETPLGAKDAEDVDHAVVELEFELLNDDVFHELAVELAK